MAGFLRRLRRDKEKPADSQAAEATEESGPSPDPGPATGSVPVGPSSPQGPTPPPEDLAPTGPPPPLPQPDLEGSRPERFSHAAPLVCFVCGTAMQGNFCPTCRMNWVE